MTDILLTVLICILMIPGTFLAVEAAAWIDRKMG